MVHIHHIASLDLPELAPYRTLKRSAEHELLGLFVTEGDKVVLDLLASRFAVVSLLVPPERLTEFETLARARPEADIALYVCPKKILRELVGFEIYQGVLAIGKIPAPTSLAEILAATADKHSRPRFFAAMDGLGNAENVGVLLRNCAALGVQALIAGETCSSPYVRRSVRNSMGAVFKMPVVELGRKQERRDAKVITLVETLGALRAAGVRCVAAHPSPEGKTLWQADFTGDVCVVLGSEGDGLSPEVLAACDEAVSIPMANAIDSLNVGNAAAVFLAEVVRQRQHWSVCITLLELFFKVNSPRPTSF
ncbi:MAG: hypothetical protein RLZZ350_1489 [Verrucomicrobiota bacterium]